MTLAKVTGGAVVGKSQEGIHLFRGIPFAAPISGANLWRAPQPVVAWSGTREATQPGKACYQPKYSRLMIAALRMRKASKAFIGTIGPIGTTVGDDCLNLNVWTPTMDPDARLPVIVWIHGGGFTSGSGAAAVYDGTALAAKGIVVVTINYRLGIFGFMGGDDLFPDGVGIANRGFLDQLAALRWVHENIRAFGGDRDCVTVMGESAGATSAIAMMMSPKTDGLIRRVACLSGAAISVFPHEEYSRFARDYFEQVLGVRPGDAEALMRLSVEQVRAAAPGPPQFLGKHRDRYGALGRDHFTVFGMATGTELFPLPLADAIRAGNKRDIDLLIGTCRDESRTWSLSIPGPTALTTRAMFRYHSGILNPREDPAATFKNYKAAMPGASALQIYERAMTDALFRKWSVAFAGTHSETSPGRTFLYRFDWRSPAVNGALGALHTLDLPGVFQNYRQWSAMIGSEEAARPAGDALHDAIVSFVKTGTPRSERFPPWSPYDTTHKACMVFDTHTELRHDIDAAFEKIW
ncbi:MAG TPA: carboxylesterase family protein [Nevskiaceae bacterium]|nr:carboxylesterase family protein [Nevskiaceae bacterium]